MSDDLAQQLYAAFRANVDPEQPSWGNLSSLDREAWDVVATKARNVMLDRVFAVVAELEKDDDIEPIDELVLLRERFGR
jgi:hypothetical protein